MKWTKEQLEAQAYTIRYLLDIANNTDGAGVWRALLGEINQQIERDTRELAVKQ